MIEQVACQKEQADKSGIQKNGNTMITIKPKNKKKNRELDELDENE